MFSMTRCLIKNSAKSKQLGLLTRCLTNNNSAFTLVELMIAVGFSVLLMTGVYGFYNASSQAYSSGISGQNLQDGANIVLSKIIEGETESGVVYRLGTSTSYMIPNGVGTALYTCGGSARATPCNTANTSSELYYCQDSLCGTGDATARWYYLNSTATSIIYHHPKTGGGTIEETLYTAPSGSSMSLRFSPALNNGVTIPNVIEIDVDLAKTLAAQVTNSRLATSGDASTFVLMRNHS
jgi:Tfp pilus assembly protein PilW